MSSLNSYFSVPKGEDDIHMMFDLTMCGFNDVLWVPTFWLPTILNVFDCAIHSSFFGDIDIGEMFLNFKVHPDHRPYLDIDEGSLGALVPHGFWYESFSVHMHKDVCLGYGDCNGK